MHCLSTISMLGRCRYAYPLLLFSKAVPEHSTLTILRSKLSLLQQSAGILHCRKSWKVSVSPFAFQETNPWDLWPRYTAYMTSCYCNRWTVQFMHRKSNPSNASPVCRHSGRQRVCCKTTSRPSLLTLLMTKRCLSVTCSLAITAKHVACR